MLRIRSLWGGIEQTPHVTYNLIFERDCCFGGSPFFVIVESATKYYTFNGQRIAMQRTDGVSGESKTYYLHTDHPSTLLRTSLGNIVSVTDAGGTLTPKLDPTDPTISQRYYAYGRERVGSVSDLPTDYAFTGQKQDSTGLMYFNFRYFDPEIGAFISPDTLIPTPTDLYSYNRYMAFRGNPMKFNDPSGHFANWVIGGTLGFAVGVAGYLASESQQQDGVDLSIDVSWNGWTPSVNIGNDWGDLMTAGVSGAVAGLLIATPGAGSMGASMAGNLVSDHMNNILSGGNFVAEEHAFSGAVGASVGMATAGIGGLLGKANMVSGKSANFALGVGSKALVGGVMDTLGNPDLLSGKAYPSMGGLASNIGLNLFGEGFGEVTGAIGRFASRTPWSLKQTQTWEGAMSVTWKYLESMGIYVANETSSD